MKVGIVEKELKKMQDSGIMPMDYTLKHVRLMSVLLGLAGLLTLALSTLGTSKEMLLAQIFGIWMTVCGFLAAAMAHREDRLKEDAEIQRARRLLD